MGMLPRENYMDWQEELDWSKRSYIMEWIVLQHMRLDLVPETLFLAVNYVDRFLSQKVISASRLQLVGAAALLLATKYEEIDVPTIGELEFITDNQYTREEITKAERYMLLILNYELGFPSPLNFVRRISKADGYDSDVRTLAKYFLEVTIMDRRFVGSPPSFLAAASQCLARLVLGGEWQPAHVHLSGYTYPQLLPALEILVSVCRNPSPHHYFIWSKYAAERFRRVSDWALNVMARFRLPPTQHSPIDYIRRGPDGYPSRIAHPLEG